MLLDREIDRQIRDNKYIDYKYIDERYYIGNRDHYYLMSDLK